MNSALTNDEAPGGNRGLPKQLITSPAQNSSTAPVVQYYPKDGTVIAAVLTALLLGDRLTPRDALNRFGTLRLAAVAYRLREYGWPIMSREIAVRTATGRTAYVGLYWMEATR